ncbi:MAG: CRISPR-associated helicase Cas3' [Rhodothermia bacterium]|nr:CRISPR-associated helicase Cas3' [Rhodothermia bacterium]
MSTLAKSSGITLRQHTNHVIEEVLHILDCFPFIENKYKQLTTLDLRAMSLNCAEYHDKGKAHKTWQSACKADYEQYERWCKQTDISPTIDAYHQYEQYAHKNKIGSKLLSTRLRHEFASLEWLDAQKITLSWIERAAIAAHHGKLGYKFEERWLNDGKSLNKSEGPYKKFWNEFRNHQNTARTKDSFIEALNKRYQLSAVRSLLQLADTRASRKESGGWLPPFTPFQYNFPHCDQNGNPSYRGVQAVVQQYWDEPTLILRAPTGSGKTDASLLWAKHQIQKNRADRLVIAMPTRFTSNALSININESVSDTGLYHSSAWYSRFQKTAKEQKTDLNNAKEVHKLARLLNTPVTVSTIDHLLISLTGTREDHHAIFFNLMNACVVIDEADFYDPFVQANMVVLLNVLKYFHVPVLIMSATVPASAKKLYAIPVIAEDTSQIYHAKASIKVYDHMYSLDDLNELLKLAMEQPSIIYANTVERAVQYYDWFTERGFLFTKLYHSRFTEPDKARIEAELIEMLGKKAWVEGSAKGIAIMTQIGEMSINISAPFMISDLCPYDRLAQRAGRLNRFTDDPGHLHVVIPYKNSELYPAPYGSYDLSHKVWIAGKAFQATQATIKNKSYAPADFVDEVNKLYPMPEPMSGKIELNVNALNNHLENHWMIIPLAKLEEDAEETGHWKSRDIDPQCKVFVNIDDNDEIYDETKEKYRVRSWGDFRGLELECAISIPIYERDKGAKSDRIIARTILIDDVELPFWYAPYYDKNRGLYFDHEQKSNIY